MSETLGALEGLEVVEFGQQVAASYCTKLLADLGATVTKVESPRGDPLRHCGPFAPGAPDAVGGGLFHYLNANKSSVVADLAHGSDPLVDELVAGADIVVENFRPGVMESFGLGPEKLLAGNPDLVMVRISNFGQDGPWRDRLATGLTLQAEAGMLVRLGEPGQRPTHIVGRLAEYVGGTFAAAAALGGVLTATRGGSGAVVDVSLFETFLYSLIPADVVNDVLRILGMSLPDRNQSNPGYVKCLDGIVCVSTLTGQHWKDLCSLIGAEDWGPRQDVQFDVAARAEFLALVEAWTSTRPVNEVVETMQAFRLPAAPPVDGRTMLELSQLVERGFFVPQPGASFLRPAAPYRLSVTPVTLRSPAPRLGEHNGAVESEEPTASGETTKASVPGAPSASDADRLPLAGVRVVDMTSFLSGGHLTEYLSAFGADVVKIESARRPDGFRFVMAYPVMGEHWWERSPLWQAQNLGKRSVVLELSEPEGREVLASLIARSDVIAENYTPRVLESFGFGYDQVREINPDIVMVRMPGFGLEGPWRDHVGFANSIEQWAGMAQNGDPDGPFVQPYGIVDVVNGQHAVVATLAALRHKENGGGGQLIEVAQVETVASLTADQVIEYQLTGECRPRSGNRERGIAPQGIYPCRDGRWIAISVVDDAQWQALFKEMGAPSWAQDPRYAALEGRWADHDLFDEHIGAWTAPQEVHELAEALQRAGVPAGIVATHTEIPTNSQLRARDYHRVLPHAYSGTQRYQRPPVIFSFGELAQGPAPTLGQHNHEVLRELGLDDTAIADLEDRGALATDFVG